MSLACASHPLTVDQLPAPLRALVEGFEAQASEYREWENALAACNDATSGFLDYAELAGVSGGLVLEGHSRDLGYARPVPTEWHQETGHAVALLECAGTRFSIDWTAAQYGRSEFPLLLAWSDGPLPGETYSH